MPFYRTVRPGLKQCFFYMAEVAAATYGAKYTVLGTLELSEMDDNLDAEGGKRHDHGRH